MDPAYSLFKFTEMSPPSFGTVNDRFRTDLRSESSEDNFKIREHRDFTPVWEAIEFIRKHMRLPLVPKPVSFHRTTVLVPVTIIIAATDNSYGLLAGREKDRQSCQKG